MIVVFDTNVIVSAFISPASFPAKVLKSWFAGNFTVVTCEQQLSELRATFRKPKFAGRFPPHQIGRTMNLLRQESIGKVKNTHTALDPTDSFLLDLAAAASADYLVTGDKRSGLLQLGKLGNTRILLPSEFCDSVLKA